ncbi:lysophospholipid acyltransferase family protein [Candidatus Caldatribacterium sp. SIUC1]|uniref:lysophospholipid acyltransferase family protein n=1 Tax=Candidatus Caldatribacterium sp. SIUC1 TaxID=3418365 RepID=UPI003F68DF33
MVQFPQSLGSLQGHRVLKGGSTTGLAWKRQNLPGETLLWRLGKRILAPYFLGFPLEVEGELPPPPFLLIANHLSALDPFLIDALVPYPIVWVANRLIFEHPFLGPLIRAVSAIPKRKALPDCRAVRGIFRVLERGGVVGLFPEGGIPWNGVNRGVTPATEKLLARLQVPVVFAHIQGAWIRKPLWADHSRRGPVFIRFTLTACSSLLSFWHSEWEWQKRHRIPFQGERRAEGIERVVFFCPACGKFRSIVGKGNEVLCLSCHRRWTIDAYGFIDGLTQEEFTANQESLLGALCEHTPEIVFPKVLITERTHPGGALRSFSFGPVVVNREGLLVRGKCFPFSEIRGENTFLKKVFEYTSGRHLIRLHLEKDACLLLSLVRLRKGNVVQCPSSPPLR